MWFGREWRETSVWSRLELPAGSPIAGPAILDQGDATIVIEPEFTGHTDALGNVVVKAATE